MGALQRSVRGVNSLIDWLLPSAQTDSDCSMLAICIYKVDASYLQVFTEFSESD